MPGIEPNGEPVRLTSNFTNGITHLPLRLPPASGGRPGVTVP